MFCCLEGMTLGVVEEVRRGRVDVILQKTGVSKESGNEDGGGEELKIDQGEIEGTKHMEFGVGMKRNTLGNVKNGIGGRKTQIDTNGRFGGRSDAEFTSGWL